MNIGSLKRKSRRRLLWAARHTKDCIRKKVSKKPRLSVYWSHSDNFGEWITALILEKMGLYATYARVEDAKVASHGKYSGAFAARL